MESEHEPSYTAFEGTRRIVKGDPVTVALATKTVLDRGERGPVLVFDDKTGEQVELDLRGTAEEVRDRLASRVAPTTPRVEPPGPRGPGRPRLGVVGREVTLLPRHWEWLASQPGGASVALRKLVEEARRTHADRDQARRRQEAAYRFLSAMAGNLPDFEEAIRAFFAGDQARFEILTEPWPADIRQEGRERAARAFGGKNVPLGNTGNPESRSRGEQEDREGEEEQGR